jgi:hypothetical protein
MPDNVTNAEAMVAADAAPPTSVSNWPGDKGAAVAPPPASADPPADAPKAPADGGTPPAATETPPAEGAVGQADAGNPPATDGGEPEPEPGAAGDGQAAKPPADKSLAGRLSARTRERNEIREDRDKIADLLSKAIEKLGDGAAAAKPPTDPAAPGATPPAQAEAPDPRPTRDRFDDPEAYDEAVDAWSRRQTAKVVNNELERREQARAAGEQQAKRAQENREFHQHRTLVWEARVAELEANEATADFRDKAYSEDVPVPDAMAAMLLTLDRGPDVLLYLAEHPDEAKEISAIANQANRAKFNPQVAFAELYAIQKQLGKTGMIKAQVSKTPAPINPVRNNNRAAAKDVNSESMEEYGARRAAELQGQRRGSMFGNRGTA